MRATWFNSLGFLGVISFLVLQTSPSSAAPSLGATGFRPSVAEPLGWRGDGTGRFVGAEPPISWATNKNIRWSALVGQAHSSPVVTERLVFVTAEPNRLLCLDRSSGQVRWRLETRPSDLSDAEARQAAAAYVPPKDGSGLAAATPLTDGTNVYVLFANGIIHAVDVEGRSRWTAFIGAEQNTAYGRSSSPIIAGGRLIVHLTHLYAFDPATGKRLWVNTDAKSTYGTPAAITVGGLPLIVTPGGDLVRAEDGKGVLSGLGRSQYSSPLVAHDMIYFADRSVRAVRLTAKLTAEDLREAEMRGDIFGSPLLHEGLLFLTTGKGELFVFDTRAKEPQNPIIEGRPLFADEESAVPITYASLTLAGQHLFLSSNKGETVVLEPAREAKVLATHKLPAGSGATPAFADKHLFLRAGAWLYCIGD
jgi:outer membrane protein assembly factor BamB